MSPLCVAGASKMVDRIKISIIGAGRWANKVHYPSLAEFKDVEIKAVCDLDENRLKQTSEKYNIEETFTDYKQMLRKTSLDAVYVIMFPVPVSHYERAEPLVEVVSHCLEKKKDVFIEKPPGTSVEETRRMAEEAAANDCRTMVGFNRRFIPIVREAKRIVEARGAVTHCSATFHKNQIGQPRVWGVLDHLTADVIHSVDALRWISGSEVKKIASHVDSFRSDSINSFNALMIFENGAVGHLDSCYTAGARTHRFEMHANGISAYVDLPQETARQEARIIRDNQPYEEAEVIKSSELVGSEEFHKCYGYYQENRYFIDCIKQGAEPEPNFADAVKTMQLIDRIKESTILRL
ncbi:MAG: Gfo/Idh/MocA family oxidoreductase [Candidatus Bathyarchaeota archaeon]|nr:Gfo/Idh/MocA family oxidoreductase [Candidatus Bathyarchaeota archaeon]